MSKILAHPLALEYPRASEAEKALIKADMKARGYDERFPIVLFGGKILDGITRNECADELNINPYFSAFDGDLDDAAAFVVRANEHRRHLTAEWLAEKRSKRIQREVEARLDGKSVAEIAEAENVTVRTVERDLQEAANSSLEQFTPTDDAACRGKCSNGKSTEKPMCNRCKLNKSMGRKAVKGCTDCKKLNAKPKPEAVKPKPQSDLPKSVQNALADTWHADCARTLGGMITQVKGAVSWSTWLDATALIEHLKAAKDCFLTAIPTKVCDECKGQKKIDKESCKRCHGGGYLASQE